MTRDNLQFYVRYSFHLEDMQATLLNRLDRILTFTQIMLGSAIFAAAGNSPLFGFLVTALTTLTFVWQPARAAVFCEQQSAKLKELITQLDSSTESDEAIHAAFLDVQKTDSPNIGLLRDVAHKRANLALDRKEQARKTILSRCQKLVTLLAGDLPKDPPHRR